MGSNLDKLKNVRRLVEAELDHNVLEEVLNPLLREVLLEFGFHVCHLGLKCVELKKTLCGRREEGEGGRENEQRKSVNIAVSLGPSPPPPIQRAMPVPTLSNSTAAKCR
jgi:hypothetical protein